jgi:Uma2 family endonuclease
MSTYAETVVPPIRQTLLSESGQCVILNRVSWGTYEQLLSENGDNSNTHFTYDQGLLEIMVLSAEHENYKDIISLLINVIAEEMGIAVVGYGSTTFKRKDLARGFEPDACFYIQNEARMRGKKRINLSVDPAPDLVIEIDITSPSLNKFPIFAALGVAEIWRYDGERVGIFALQAGQYVEQAESVMLPPATGNLVIEWVDASQSMKRTAWLRLIREWARGRRLDS